MSYQQINLYRNSDRRGGLTFNLPTIAIAAVALVALLVALGLSGQNNNQQLAAQLDSLQQQLEQLQQKSAALRSTLAENDAGNLEQRQQQAQQELLRLQQIRELMARQQAGGESSFAGQLSGLSQNHLQGISLAQIHLLDGGRYLSLSGAAQPAEAVPQYLQKLQADRRFDNARFGPLQMQRDKKRPGLVQFQLGETPTSDTGATP